MTWIEWARVVACALVIVAAGRFCIRYHRKTKGHWRDTPYGVHMMLFTGAFVLYFGYAVLSLLLLPAEWRPYTGTVIILSLAGLFVWRDRLLDEAQRERVHAETEEE